MKFDIILPSIGRPSLQEAVDSVLAQTHTDWNLYVILDGQTRLQADFAFNDHNDSRIERHFSLDRHNDSGAWARNEGIALGKNPWIAYLDCDDIWLPCHLDVLSSGIEQTPDADMIRTAGQSFKMSRKSPRHTKAIRKFGLINTSDILTVGMAHTRELFNKTQGWQPCDNHDLLLWQEMLELDGIAAETDKLTFYFQR